MENNGIIVELRNVAKSFGARIVLKDINLVVHGGEVLVVIGRSGSGKSTLLRCVAGLTRIDSGEIEVRGTPTQRVVRGHWDRGQARRGAPLQREVGMVFQNFNLFPHMRVLANITLALRRVQKMDRQSARQLALEELDKVGMISHKDNYPDELSGGQQQRVAIARALAMRPSTILFDEVTSALDPELVGEVLRVMRELAVEGMTMMVVTHEMDFARDVGDRLIFMDGGVVVEQGPPREVLAAPREDSTRVFLRRLLER